MQMQCGLVVGQPLVVVVDDDQALRNSLKFSFEVEGFEVLLYADAEQLLGDDELPDQGCLVIDFNLPGLNGLTLLARLRERGVTMPAIVMTSHPSTILRERVRAAGARMVEKPLLNNSLHDVVRAELDPPPGPPGSA